MSGNRTAPPTATLYAELFRNQWRQRARSFTWRRHWFVLLMAGLLGLYFATALIVSGLMWKEVSFPLRRSVDPVDYLNRNLLTIFLALFVARFFLQRSPRLRILPFLRLPPTHGQLVHFFQLASLASVHNLIPLLFLLPLWARHILAGPYEAAGIAGWLVVVLLFILISHYLNNLLRALLRRNREGFAIALGVMVLLVTLDLLVGPPLLSRISAFLFSTLIVSQPLIPLSLAALLGVVYASSSLLLRDNLLIDEDTAGMNRIVAWQVPFRPPNRPVINLILLELKLMWRSERPKVYFFFSVVFATIYVAAPLLDADLAASSLVQAVVGVFASGIFALNYGQFMFSWESGYFDGILVRDVDLRRMVWAKLLILQLSCVAFFVLSLPIFLVLAPDLVDLHVSFMFYNAGVSTLLVLTLALGNRKHIRLANVGFFNYEGFSLVHWLWFIPTVVPPAIVLFALADRRPLALLLIGGVGLLSLLFTGTWASLFGSRLERSALSMAAGFRSHES